MTNPSLHEVPMVSDPKMVCVCVYTKPLASSDQ